MAFTDPIAVYHAADSLEAHLVSNLLNEADIAAMVAEDSQVGGLGLMALESEAHKPQVWIERADVDRARPVLDEYHRRTSARRNADAADGSIEVLCEECGRISSFPASQKGSVQDCPHCHEYVDVGEVGGHDEWSTSTDNGPGEA